MKRNVRKAMTAIKKIFPQSTLNCPDRPDDTFMISCGRGEDSIDYYGEFQKGHPWVDPRIESILADNDLHFEWNNPECGTVWE